MIQSKQPVKIKSLKAKTVKFLAEYKLTLNATAQLNRKMIVNFKVNLASDLFEGRVPYAVLIEIFFSTNDVMFAAVINTLRNKKVSYYFLTQFDLQTILTAEQRSTFGLTNLRPSSLLLAVTSENEMVYRELIALFIDLEKSSAAGVFNNFQILRIKEKSSLVSFAKPGNAVRSLYDVKNTQRVILLETLNALNSALFTIPMVLHTTVDTLRVVPVENFWVSFPFKRG